MSFWGLRRVLSKAVSVSVSWTTGAGGMSIAPTLVYHAIVDSEISPAFQIMRLFRKIISTRDLLEYEHDELLRSCTWRLLSAVAQGRARPTDSDNYSNLLGPLLMSDVSRSPLINSEIRRRNIVLTWCM
jgi:hypothetical protein